MPDFRTYQGVDFSSGFLVHYGVGHLQGGHSGRWPWGSGENGGGATRSARDRYKTARTNYKTAKRALSNAEDHYNEVMKNPSSTSAEKRSAKREYDRRIKALDKADSVYRDQKSSYKEAKSADRLERKQAKAAEKANRELDKKENKLQNVTGKDLEKLSDKELSERINRIRQEDTYRQSIGQDILSKLRRDKDSNKAFDRSILKKEDRLENISNKEIGEMTDKELNDRINRLRQEDTYRQLIGQKTLSQLRREKDLPKEIAKEAGITLAKNGLNALVNKVIIPTATGHIIYSLAQGRRNAENAEIEKYNKEHPDDPKMLKADVDYVSTVFKDAKFLSTKDKNGEGGGKKDKNRGKNEEGGGKQQNKEKNQAKEKETSNATLEDVKKVIKDMVDMSGAKEILEGATKRVEKEKAKEAEKAQKKALDADKSGNSKSEDKEEYKSWNNVETKKDNRSTDNDLYADKPAKEKKTKEPRIEYDSNNDSTYTIEGNSDKQKSNPSLIERLKRKRDKEESLAGNSTFPVPEEKKAPFDYNNNSTYTTEGSSDKPYKRTKAEREELTRYATFEKPTAKEASIERGHEEYREQSAPSRDETPYKYRGRDDLNLSYESNPAKYTSAESNKKSDTSTQKLEIFYDSNPGQFTKKEQKEFSSAIASVTSILRSIGSSTPSKQSGGSSRKDSSDAIGRLKQNEDAWEAIAKSVSPDVLADAEKISKATTEYTYDLLEKNMKILNKYSK